MKIAVILLLLVSPYALADDDYCPDGTYRRGDTCDSCPWAETLARYRNGELSTTRKSQVFEHSIRVSVACDTNRPVDVDDVFEKLAVTERTFDEFLGFAIRRNDGEEFILEIITGICDYEEGGESSAELTDDCNMYEICKYLGGGNCGLTTGRAFAYLANEFTHTAFVPFSREGVYWWVEGNRYGNLQHEFAHLLDYTYFRDTESGTDLDWWVEGMPQFIQWKILNDRASWDRGNDEAHLLEIFTHRWNTNNYYDGMRVFAYLNTFAPHWLEWLATDVRNGIYRDADTHLDWHRKLGNIAWLHEFGYRDYVTRGSDTTRMRTHVSDGFKSIVEGVGEPEYINPERVGD
ncbi:MAG: hypothetical protein OXG05_10635 [Gammaproteobacteria bacterium]|nr:hypothetical protein [Gammaproteobacteria bacterium]